MFSPTSVSGCYVWVYADGISGTNNADLLGPSGTPTVVSNFGYGGGIFLPNSSGIIYHTNRLNTHATIEITSGQGLRGLGATMNPLSSLTAFYVYKLNSSVTGSGYLLTQTFQPGTSGEVTNYSGLLIEPSGYGIYTSNGTVLATNVSYQGSWLIRSDTWTSPQNYNFNRNSSSVASGTTSFSLPNVPSGNFNLFNFNGENTTYTGEVAEVIYYDNALVQTDLYNIESYLKNKYFVGGGGNANVVLNGLIPAPTGIPGCAIWFQGDSATNNGIGNPAGNVWSNQGYLAGTLSSIRPPILGSGLNGHAYFDYSAANVVGYNNTLTSDYRAQFSSYTAFFVYKPTNLTGPQSLTALSYFQSGYHAIGGLVITPSGYYANSSPFDTNLNDPAPIYIPDTPNPGMWNIQTHVYASGVNQFRLNSTYLGTASGSYEGQGTNGVFISMGIGQQSTNLTNYVNVFHGQIAEVIFYDHPLTSGQLYQVESYLANKYTPVPAMTANTTVFISGVPNSASGNTTVYVSGAPPVYSISGQLKLFTANVNPMSGGMNLYIGSAVNVSGQATIYGFSSSFSIGSMPLVVFNKPAPVQSGRLSLYTTSSPSGVSSLYTNTTMYTYSTGKSAAMPIFTTGPTKGLIGAGMPVFLGVNTPSGVAGNRVPIFVGNNFQNSGKATKLYVRGAGGTNGGSSINGAMPVFLGRLPAGMATMFIQGYQPGPPILGGDLAFNTYTFDEVEFNANRRAARAGVQMFLGANNLGSTSGQVPIYIGSSQSVATGVPIYLSPFQKIANGQGLRIYTNGF